MEKNLSKSNYWGGSETLLSISELFIANIVVFDENGPYSFATGFNEERRRVLFLAYRNANHYDSICYLDNYVINSCTNNLAKVAASLKNEETVEVN